MNGMHPTPVGGRAPVRGAVVRGRCTHKPATKQQSKKPLGTRDTSAEVHFSDSDDDDNDSNEERDSYIDSMSDDDSGSDSDIIDIQRPSLQRNQSNCTAPELVELRKNMASNQTKQPTKKRKATAAPAASADGEVTTTAPSATASSDAAPSSSAAASSATAAAECVGIASQRPRRAVKAPVRFVDEYCEDARSLYLQSVPDEDLKKMLKHLQKDVNAGQLGPSGKAELAPLTPEQNASATAATERRLGRVLARLQECTEQFARASCGAAKASLKKRKKRLTERAAYLKDELRILRLSRPHQKFVVCF